MGNAPQVVGAMDKPEISVVIVTYNRRKDLEAALESCAGQIGVALEVVVVDNGSTDGTAEWLTSWRKLPTILYRVPRNLGASIGRNIGIRLSRGALIAFMDSDAVALDRDLLLQLKENLLKHPDVAATAPAIYEDAERQRIWFLAGYANKAGYHDLERSRREHENCEYISTCFSLWKREVLYSLRGFDPAYPYVFEDLDLCIRARDRGWRFLVLPHLGVHHRLSTEGRVRPYDTYAHRLYTERVMNRFYVLRLGLRGFLRRWRWWLSPEGREYRRIAYIDFTPTFFQRLELFWWVPLKSLLLYPFWKLQTHLHQWRL